MGGAKKQRDQDDNGAQAGATVALEAETPAVHWPSMQVGSAKRSVKAEDFKVIEPDFRWSPPGSSSSSLDERSSDASMEVACGVFVVLDGHGGPQAGSMCKAEFITLLRASLDSLVLVQPLDESIEHDRSSSDALLRPVDLWWRANLPEALRQTFVALDRDCCQQFQHSGTTASAVVVTREYMQPKRKDPLDARPGYAVQITAANVGDSSIYLQYEEATIAKGASARRSRMQMLSEDHRLQTNKREQRRVFAQGGSISHDGRSRGKALEGVDDEDAAEVAEAISQAKNDAQAADAPMRMWPGGLMMSRTLGDRDAKFSSPEPCIRQCVLLVGPDTCGGGGGRIIMGSDGLWDEITPKNVASESKTKRAQSAANHLTQLASKRAGAERDDITVVVVDLLPFEDMKSPFDNSFIGNPKRSRAFARRQSLSVRQRAMSHDLPSVVVWEPELGQPSVWPESVVEWVNQSAESTVSVPGKPVTIGSLKAGTVVNVQLDVGSEEISVMSVVAVDEEDGCVLVEKRPGADDGDTEDVVGQSSAAWVFAEQCGLAEQNKDTTTTTEGAAGTVADEAHDLSPGGVVDDATLLVEAIEHSVREAGGSEGDVQRAILDAIDGDAVVDRRKSLDVAEAAAILRAQRLESTLSDASGAADSEEWQDAPQSNRTKARLREEAEQRQVEAEKEKARLEQVRAAKTAAALKKQNDARSAKKAKKNEGPARQAGGGGAGGGGVNLHQLYVGNLDSDATKAMVMEHFGQFGDVAKCVLRKVGGAHTSASAKSKQYAFVSFRGENMEEAAVNALAHKRHEVNGRAVKVKPAAPKDSVGGRGGNAGGKGPQGAGGGQKQGAKKQQQRGQSAGKRVSKPKVAALGEAAGAPLGNQQQRKEQSRQQGNQRKRRTGGKAPQQQQQQSRSEESGAAVRSYADQ
jgi:serine/threonine protein phosphatase PrpC